MAYMTSAAMSLTKEIYDAYMHGIPYFNTWYFCDWKNPLCHRIVILHQWVGDVYNIMTQVTTDCLIFSFIHNIDLQLKLFSQRLSEISWKKETEEQENAAKKCVLEYNSILA